MRNELKNPLGEVVSEEQLESILKDVERIVTVGDRCSLTLHERGLAPHIAVVDFLIERKDVKYMKKELQKIVSPVKKRFDICFENYHHALL